MIAPRADSGAPFTGKGAGVIARGRHGSTRAYPFKKWSSGAPGAPERATGRGARRGLPRRAYSQNSALQLQHGLDGLRNTGHEELFKAAAEERGWPRESAKGRSVRLRARTLGGSGGPADSSSGPSARPRPLPALWRSRGMRLAGANGLRTHGNMVEIGGGDGQWGDGRVAGRAPASIDSRTVGVLR